jgi:DNA-directed RNA polymerase specialized sigma24 family protein
MVAKIFAKMKKFEKRAPRMEELVGPAFEAIINADRRHTTYTGSRRAYLRVCGLFGCREYYRTVISGTSHERRRYENHGQKTVSLTQILEDGHEFAEPTERSQQVDDRDELHFLLANVTDLEAEVLCLTGMYSMLAKEAGEAIGKCRTWVSNKKHRALAKIWRAIPATQMWELLYAEYWPEKLAEWQQKIECLDKHGCLHREKEQEYIEEKRAQDDLFWKQSARASVKWMNRAHRRKAKMQR